MSPVGMLMTFLDQRLAGTRSSPYMMKINHSLQCPMLPSSAILKAQKKKKKFLAVAMATGFEKASVLLFCFLFLVSWFKGVILSSWRPLCVVGF